MRYNNLKYFIPAFIVLLANLVIIAVNYSHLPAQIPAHLFDDQETDIPQMMSKGMIWMILGLNVVVSLLMILSANIPWFRKHSFRIRLGGKTVMNASDVLTPQQEMILYAATALLLSLIFTLITCIMIFPDSIIYKIFFYILVGIGIIAGIAVSVWATKKGLSTRTKQS